MNRGLGGVLMVVALSTLLVLPAATWGGEAAKATSEVEADVATTAVKASLALLDQGQYGEMWEQAAPYFKNAVPKETWVQQASAVRAPLGKLVSRDTLGSKAFTSLPGAPDGEYVVFQFNTKFEKKAEAVETVTVKKDAEGTYRLSGYYIK